MLMISASPNSESPDATSESNSVDDMVYTYSHMHMYLSMARRRLVGRLCSFVADLNPRLEIERPESEINE